MPYNLRLSTLKGTIASKYPLKEVYDLVYYAESGNPSAQYNLGMTYYHPEKGFPKSTKKAIYWIKKAADNGNIFAIWHLETYKIGSLPAN
jgi:hypothetical protein